MHRADDEDRRLATLYAIQFAVSGAWGPYLAPWLRHAGFDPATAGAVLAAMAAVRTLSSPLWGFVADWLQRTARLLTLTGALGAVCGLLTLTADAPAVVVAALLTGALFRGPISSLLDTIVLRSLARRGAPDRYGGLRAWGSAGFLVAGGLSGFAAEVSPALPIWGAVGLLIAAAWRSRHLPDEPPAPRPDLGAALRWIFGSARMRWMWAAAALHGVALSAYDTFYADRIAEVGLPARWTGAALVVGVLSEIALFWRIRPHLHRLHPLTWASLGAGVGAVRWALTAWLTSGPALTVLALAHALSFAAWWAGSVELLRRELPDGLRASGQALLMTTAYGVGPFFAGVLASRTTSTAGLFAAAAVCSLAAVGLLHLSRAAGPLHPSPAGDGGAAAG